LHLRNSDEDVPRGGEALIPASTSMSMSSDERPNPEPSPPPAKYLSSILAGVLRESTERHLLDLVRKEPVPHHLGLIMDGNRRFAHDHGLLTEEGHLKGKDKLEELLNWCLEVDVRILTVYALSTENLQRSDAEVTQLMDLFAKSFQDIAHDARVHKHRIHVAAIGNRSVLRPDVVAAIDMAEAATKEYSDYFYNVAIAYGGREEIVRAIRRLATQVAAGELRPEEIDDRKVSENLYTANLPDPDLVLRTSGEERISNFLLWQVAYSELYFADVMWPGLTKTDFLRAIRAFQLRRRNFGK
jgi:tritrans,polycis-undecaprenyl-diphosphate synthase [geranylgeranyl-diphosphate specific]